SNGAATPAISTLSLHDALLILNIGLPELKAAICPWGCSRVTRTEKHAFNHFFNGKCDGLVHFFRDEAVKLRLQVLCPYAAQGLLPQHFMLPECQLNHYPLAVKWRHPGKSVH